MESKKQQSIKTLMNEIPAVADVLNDFDIACAECHGADCLLGDVVDIHQMPLEQELDFMYRLEKALYPDRDVKKPDLSDLPPSPVTRKFNYSPPMKKLVDEHVYIKKLVALIPRIAADVDILSDDGRQLILDSVDFIRNYADKYHHAKEEDILFEYFDESFDIIKVIREDHVNGRNYVKGVLEGLEAGNRDAVIANLINYAELLTEHIRKEDEVLYPWMDRNLDTRQIGELFNRFHEVDREFGKDYAEKYQDFACDLENKFENEKGEGNNGTVRMSGSENAAV